MRFLASTVLIVLAGLFALSGAAHAQTSIKIVVNGMPITDYDISQRVRLLDITRQGGGTEKAKEDLINEAVQVSEVTRRGGTIPVSEIEGAYATVAGGLKMSPSQLTAALGMAGIAPETLKNRLKAQIGWSMLMRAKLSAEAKKNAKDVTAVLLSGKEKDAALVREYMLQQIIFIAPKGSSADFLAQRKREAEAFRGRFKGCEQSVEMAKTLKNVVVKEIGRRDTSQLSQGMTDMLKNVAEGKTSAPSNGDQGVELVAVCSVRDIQSTEVARDRIETKLALAQGETIGKDYLKELRSQAIIQYR